MSRADVFLWLGDLNALAGGLFLLATFGMLAMRQVKGCLWFFVLQSACLCASAFLLGVRLDSWHAIAVGAIDLINKPIIVPWLLRRTVREEVFSRREVTQVLNIPTSLLIASALVIAAYALAAPLLRVLDGPGSSVNLPIGLAGLLVVAGLVRAPRSGAAVLGAAGNGELGAAGRICHRAGFARAGRIGHCF